MNLRKLSFLIIFFVTGPAFGASPLAPAPVIAPPLSVIQNNIVVENSYAYATTPIQKSAAVFFTITNKGTIEDRLIAASSPIADKAEFQTNLDEDGAVVVTNDDSYPLAAGEIMTLDSKNHHIMLINLHEPLKAKQSFPLKLKLQKAGDLDVIVTIRPDDEDTEENKPIVSTVPSEKAVEQITVKTKP
jgi:copper(I)-binding protein